MERAIGADFSRHQGTALNFDRLHEVGISFVFLRFSVGTDLDETFERNYAAAQKAGLWIGAYHYMWANDIPAQVAAFTRLAANRLDLPMVVDFEQTEISESSLRLMLDEVERITGRIPMIYTRASIWHSVIGRGRKEWAERYPLWIAHYADRPQPLMPDAWALAGLGWSFWQHSETGRIPEHPSGVDLNYYNGTVQDLACQYRQPAEGFKLAWPVDSEVVTQGFGLNPAHYKPLGVPGHEGVDFRAPHGANIYACADGTVIAAYEGGAYGRQVRIDHHNGYTTIYGHLDRWLVNVGDSVTAGQKIGLADNTGNSSGSHLHLSLKYRGATAAGQTSYPNDLVDPTPFLVKPAAPAPLPAAVKLRSKATTNLRIRSGKGTNTSIIGQIAPKGEVNGYPVPDEAWWWIKQGFIEGWVTSEYLEPVDGAIAAVQLRSKATLNLRIRATPDANGTIIGKVAPSESVMGYPVPSQAYWKVTKDTIVGWVVSEWLEAI